MSVFSEQDPLDPDDPELDYTPLRLSERAAKLGLSVSQGARSGAIRSSPFARRTRNLDRRAALLSVAARVAAIAGVLAVVAVVALLFVIVKPASRQSVAVSTPSDITGSTSTALAQSSQGTAPPQSSQGSAESKPALAEFKALVEPKPALAEFKGLLAPPPGQPATREQSQQLLHRFLQWGSKN